MDNQKANTSATAIGTASDGKESKQMEIDDDICELVEQPTPTPVSVSAVPLDRKRGREE